MKIKFLGAAGTVTGSKYLLSTNTRNYLIDCGLFQGLKDLRQKNWNNFELSPSEIDAVILTHAHIDHTGYIPKLVSLGFKGPIYCSYGTFELSKILLLDSGYLQEEEARYANAKGYSKHKPALPLYTREDAKESLAYFKPINFHQPTKLFDNDKITLSRAGHILGASCVLLEAASRKIVFSGDVGRYNDLIMRSPEPLPDADYLIIESTYGDRDHEDEDLSKRFANIINAAEKNNGVILIPAFAVGRAQHILHLIHELKRLKKISDINTYLDSPMAINATDLYCDYHNEHRLTDLACQQMFSGAIIAKTPEESKAINSVRGSKIIISASGMLSGGRVLHHLAHYISDPNNVIVIVGFQAIGTRGRALLDGVPQLKMFGEYFRVEAKIEYISGLSAHADRNELIRWLKESPIKHPKVFVTHGEPKASQAFADLLREVFHWQVLIPSHNEILVL
jgi:metallo-beta-lactamase family protein